MYMTKSRLKPEQQNKYGNQINFYINRHLTDGLGMEYTAC